MDHLILYDQKLGSLFLVDKVEEAINERGHGDTAFYGLLNVAGGPDQRVIAVYSVLDALPCCVWYSYLPGQPMTQASNIPPNRTFKPLTDVPRVEFDEIIIDQVNKPPWPPDTGPLQDGEFEVVACRR
jgi:hypothetical protein